MPYKPRYQITARMLALISKAIELKTQMSQSAIRLNVLSALSRDAFVRGAHSSTAIEGNTLSLHQVGELAGGRKVEAEKKQKTEVGNYLKALKGAAQLKSTKQMTEKKLLELHRALTRDLLNTKISGKYKQRPNRVVDEKGLTVYSPPAPKDCQGLVRAMIAWQNSKSALETSPVIVSAILHHQLISIHPFANGNGRISRLWALTWLFASHFDSGHLFALDECFDADRKKYYQKLQQARDLDDDLTYWIEYVSECLVETLEKTVKRVIKFASKDLQGQVNINARQEDILNYLRDHASAKSPDLETVLKLTRSRIQQLIKPLVDAGLIKRRGQTRSTTYFLK